MRWRFRLFQRHRYNELIIEEVAEYDIVVLPQVFNPKLFRTGAFLAQMLDDALIPRQARVLDMGTGTGLGAIAAAAWASHVDAVDINPDAVRCARINALLNEKEDCIDVYRGDLFTPVEDKRYDVVLFNPPYFRGTPQDPFDTAWRSDDVVERFAAGLREHLTPTGYALVVLSSDGDVESFHRAFEMQDLTSDVVATRDLINETLTVYRLQALS